MLLFKKILIANRGEIAVRIIKAATELGIETVALYTEDEKSSVHVSLAHEAFSLGNGTLKDTFLNVKKIIQIALESECDAIHPGYGFLSENVLFAEECQNNNLTFIGPSPDVLKKMGDKVTARETAKNLNIPVISGYEISSSELSKKKDLKFPLIIKPVLGGGGKGMYIVRNLKELEDKLDSSSREALNFFANERVYVEQYLEFARHIEVQILADNFGHIVHLFDRECTIQRNFQKIIEEAPSPTLDDNLRDEITAASLLLTKAVNYTNAGTVEFILDSLNNWYFIEMNTRLQVEHPVTEMITGIDLVKQQILIAAGNQLSFAQLDIRINGHAIEMRINAEDPIENFKPSSGTISFFKYPQHCRFDTFVRNNYSISPQFDSLLGKMIIRAENRQKAINLARDLLKNVIVLGIPNNVKFLENLIQTQQFYENSIYTRFCSEYLPVFTEEYNREKKIQPIHAYIIAFIYLNFRRAHKSSTSIWTNIGYWRNLQIVRVKVNSTIHEVKFSGKENTLFCNLSDQEYLAEIDEREESMLRIKLKNDLYKVFFSFSKDGKTYVQINGFNYLIESPDLLKTAFLEKRNTTTLENSGDKTIRAPLHGRVTKINVSKNSNINRGDVLLVIESMKTENQISSPASGKVKKIFVSEGSQVKDSAPLIELE